MAIIKCKMCGGDLNLVEGSTVCECEYCGTKQTVPSADNEKKLTLFGRAGRLLRACEFDKAAGVFETIVADFPQEAEAYWGLVLCKYGIEYVDDPATGKKIPTCHRSSFDSVLDDPNFEQACENTDAVARRVYRDEARQIEELRQAILQVSGKEEPYDVFISYKETDENGDRTLDSVIAQDVYKELTNEGYRVFFSRISLEDKLGTEYEPYIFAALNSAKVMVVVGTDYENFDAVWVKNEWSRFLKLIAKGEKKTLIPVFKNMDAYDMPKEFAKLSAQDMGKVGAMQDLVRGVEKIVGKKKAETATPVQQPMYVSNEADAKTASAVKRGRLALEEGNWSRATEYFEQALTLDAECAEAYFGMALAEAECPSAEEFSRRICSQTPEQKTLYIPKAVEHIRDIVKQYRIPHFLDENEIEWHYRLFDLSYTSTAESRKALLEKEKQAFESNRNLSLAYRFAKGAYKETLQNYKRELYGTLEANAQKAEREEQEAAKEKEDKYNDFLKKSDREIEALNIKKQEERGNAYQKACQEFEEAKSSSQFKAVKAKFEFLHEYKDSEEYISRCNKKITEVEAEENKERLYASCSKVFGTAEEQTIKNWESAKSGFESLGDYKDAPALAEKCAERITQLKKAEAEAEEQKRLAEKAAAEEAERQRMLAEKAEKERKAKKKKLGILAGVLAVIAIVFVFVFTTKQQYSSRVSKYGQEAVELFESLKVGDVYTFGTYEQDNDTSNGKENIDWIVLKKEGNRILVISKDILDYKKYSGYDLMNWKKSTIRTWLNDTFLNTAFSPEEQLMISNTGISGDNNAYAKNGIPPENTSDKVFLLSIDEAEKLFPSNLERQSSPTFFAQNRGCEVNTYTSASSWLLRSPHFTSDSAKYVGFNAHVSHYVYVVDSTGDTSTYVFVDSACGIRPALWIDQS